LIGAGLLTLGSIGTSEARAQHGRGYHYGHGYSRGYRFGYGRSYGYYRPGYYGSIAPRRSYYPGGYYGGYPGRARGYPYSYGYAPGYGGYYGPAYGGLGFGYSNYGGYCR